MTSAVSLISISMEFKQGLWPFRKIGSLGLRDTLILNFTALELQKGSKFALDVHWVPKAWMPIGSAPGWDWDP